MRKTASPRTQPARCWRCGAEPSTTLDRLLDWIEEHPGEVVHDGRLAVLINSTRDAVHKATKLAVEQGRLRVERSSPRGPARRYLKD